MARSLKKGPYVHYKLDKKVQNNVESNKKTRNKRTNYKKKNHTKYEE